MFASIFILILFLPAAFLPLGLNVFFSSDELNEMGVCLESSNDSFPIQGNELIGFLSASKPCDVWQLSEPLQTCQ